MAVSIDTIYQRVLAVANKEQRGYVTPQEFNLFANQAQNQIFEQYFYDINQVDRLPRNDTEYSDPLLILEEKISLFKKRWIELTVADKNGYINLKSDLPDLYRLGTITINRESYTYSGDEIVEQLRSGKEHLLYESNPLTKPSVTPEGTVRERVMENSVYISYEDGIRIYPYPHWDISATPPSSNDTVLCNYIRKPAIAKWGYVVISKKALYDPSKSIDFELHPSEEVELVYKVLTLAGITLSRPEISQMAFSQDISKMQQEKT